jgi:hypothetical protein
MNRHLKIALLCAAAGWMAPAAAQNTQSIYRCGDSYSQQPCAGGKLVAASDTRSASQKSQTDQATRRDAKSADTMEKARLKEEAKPVPVGMPLPKPDAADETVKPAAGVKAKAKKPEHFTAVAPKKPGDAADKKKKKAKKKDA